MAKTTTPKDPAPVAEAVFGDETKTDVIVETSEVIVETPSPEHPVPVVEESSVPEVAVVDHISVSEGEEFTEPEVPAEELPLLPYAIEELGIQPVALASKTWASDFGPGGAAHTYKTAVYGEDGAIVHQSTIKFQKGGLLEVGGGINGIADSTLLSILLDRWHSFQNGPFASEETHQAKQHVLAALECLNTRTREREARGVQGKHEA